MENENIDFNNEVSYIKENLINWYPFSTNSEILEITTNAEIKLTEYLKSKTYNVTIKNDVHVKHMDYMKTDEFQELYSERYKIEAKNSELKSNFGYDTANACGKNGITIQGASALFLANIKRIIKLKNEKTKNNG